MNSDALTLESFKRNGFDTLTEIQKKAFPVVNRRGNCLLVAPTGSGKTEASRHSGFLINVPGLFFNRIDKGNLCDSASCIEQRCVP